MLGLKVPAGHGVYASASDAAPAEAQKPPEGHASHSVALYSAEKLPAAHASQPVWPVPFWEEPGKQGMQSVTLRAISYGQRVPAGQGRPASLPVGQKWLGGQTPVQVEVVSLGVLPKKPARQSRPSHW